MGRGGALVLELIHSMGRGGALVFELNRLATSAKLLNYLTEITNNSKHIFSNLDITLVISYSDLYHVPAEHDNGHSNAVSDAGKPLTTA
jgi:hypothetical protein